MEQLFFFIAIIIKLGLQILITEIEYLSHRNMDIKEIVEREWYWVQPTRLWNITGFFFFFFKEVE